MCCAGVPTDTETRALWLDLFPFVGMKGNAETRRRPIQRVLLCDVMTESAVFISNRATRVFRPLRLTDH